MLKSLLQNKLRVCAAVIIIVLLAAVRAFEDALFYDPFLIYFKTDFTGMSVPHYDSVLLHLNLLFRFVLNSFLSLLLIFIIFKNFEQLKLASLLYVGFAIVLLSAFWVVVTYFPDSKMTLFYLRRFLIQPLLLLLFIPAFYFQQLSINKNL